MNKKRIIRFVIGILFIVASIVIFETIREIQSKSGTFEDVILSQNPDVYFSAAELEQFDENMTKRTVIRGNQFIDMFNYLKNLQIQPEFPQKSAQVGYDYALSLFGKKEQIQTVLHIEIVSPRVINVRKNGGENYSFILDDESDFLAFFNNEQ